MRVAFSKMPGQLRVLTRIIREEAERLGLSVYAVGGCVRDLLLGRPILDLDITVEGAAFPLAATVAARLGCPVVRHHRFGTATLRFPDGDGVDFAGTRKETYPYPGALPVVIPGSLTEDLFRRDFAINAMAVSLSAASFGQVVDPWGGLSDLKAGRIRVLHDRSFLDDPTRIIRAFRFASRFGFRFGEPTRRLLVDALRHDAPRTVKTERYFMAFRKTFTEPSPERCWRHMAKAKAFGFLGKRFSPDFALIHRVGAGIARLARQPQYKEADWPMIYFLALLSGGDRNAILQRAGMFAFTHQERENLLAATTLSRVEKSLRKKRLKSSEAYTLLNVLPRATVLFLRVSSRVRRVQQLAERFLWTWSEMRPQLNGNDLARMGVPSGRAVGEVLQQLHLKRIDGEITSPAQERAEVKRTFCFSGRGE